MVVRNTSKITDFCQKRQILKQYLRACQYIKEDLGKMVDLKLRKPTHLGVYQFRITKKYRALACRQGSILIVYRISDHQE